VLSLDLGAAPAFGGAKDRNCALAFTMRLMMANKSKVVGRSVTNLSKLLIYAKGCRWVEPVDKFVPMRRRSISPIGMLRFHGRHDW
jgi:hypothetical protein